MESEIWRVRSEKVGKVEAFNSEYDMESFLMNNPAIIGCCNPASIRQQTQIKIQAGESGRIDLMAISIVDEEPELRVFELKNTKVDSEAVEQLTKYLNVVKGDDDLKKKIREWVLKLKLDEIDESNIDGIIEKPKGVLVGPEFDLDAVDKARKSNIKGIRLARFKGDKADEFYVIIEDQIGDVLKWAKRPRIGWSPFIDKGLIKPTDIFGITTKDRIEILARPDPDSFGTDSKKLIFEEESTRMILDKLPEREEHIREEITKWSIKWFDKVIQQIKDGKGVLISHATGLVSLVFDPSIDSCNPGHHWVHKKTNKRLNTLKDEYYEM